MHFTPKELIDYHNNHYSNHPRNDIYNHVKQNADAIVKSAFAKTPIQEVPPIDLSALEMDTDTLELMLLQNRQHSLKDHEVQNYLNSQQLHKANFLKEIQDKGLKLKGQVNPPKKKVHLDY